METVAAPPCWSAVMPDQTPSELGKTILELIRHNDGQIGWHEIAKALRADSHRRRAAIYRELKRLERMRAIRRETIDGVVRFFIVKPDGDGEHETQRTGSP
jgi:Fe2+ or Zn2+ uptake regulation protein